MSQGKIGGISRSNTVGPHPPLISSFDSLSSVLPGLAFDGGEPAVVHATYAIALSPLPLTILGNQLGYLFDPEFSDDLMINDNV